MPGSGIERKKSQNWQKKSGKNPEGGLNEKGRKSYERENPGSDLKAPTKKKGNPRRASFCARMKGMKKKLTSKKTANDPDSRINKSLRKWDCVNENIQTISKEIFDFLPGNEKTKLKTRWKSDEDREKYSDAVQNNIENK